MVRTNMISFIFQRLMAMIPTLFLGSILIFIIIQLPPGDYMTSLNAQIASSGSIADEAAMDNLRKQYGLDKPIHIQYLRWISGFARGDFGYSLEWKRPVNELIFGRLGLTLLLSLVSLGIMWLVSVPIGIYSATHKHSVRDTTLTFLSVCGLSVPDFVLGLVYIYVGTSMFSSSVIGLYTEGMAASPWSISKVVDLIKHLIWPALILSINGMAQLTRIMRSGMIEVLEQQFIVAARAKGLKESAIVKRHAVRVAINPLISVMGMQLPQLISSATVLSIVLSLPTIGPMFIGSLSSQDMYLAGSFLLLMSLILMLGNLLADIALALSDPRIRFK